MKKTFSWEPFGLAFIQSIVYSERTPIRLRPRAGIQDKLLLLPYIDSISARPDCHFVRRYRSEITDYFLKDSPNLVSLVQALERKNYRQVRMGSMEEMLATIKRLNLTSTLRTLILREMYRKGRLYVDQEENIFREPKHIDLSQCIVQELPLFVYQEEAVAKLYEHFLAKDEAAGVLVMPTGSGKTRVATRFALQDMVAAGYQVLWLTHRAMLIDQTADTMYKAAPIIRLGNPGKERFSMACVSGSHSSIKATQRDQDLMIISVQTLSRNLAYLQAVIRNKVLIIVDEAHHTLAPTYRIVIKKVRELAKDVKLLGLTATPVRMQDQDTIRLMRLFDNHIVYSISMNTLIAKGTLAKPLYTRVDTQVDFETQITLDERKYIRKWGELSPETQEYMASLKERNTLIVETYMNKRTEYGKTLMFAINGHHCISLCEELKQRGVACDYIYSAHPGNDEKIEAFKNNALEVLVNINILTEGSDVPDIQSVFLTRPTNSDVLLMQMIGRGMRGPDCDGTSAVNIVDFHDNWGSVVYWLNPRFLLENDGVEQEPGDKQKGPRTKPDTIPWEMLRDVLDGIETRLTQGLPVGGAVLPMGWYDVVDEDGNDTKVMVFEGQLPGYLALWRDRAKHLKAERVDVLEMIKTYFKGFSLQPDPEDLQQVMDIFRLEGEMPHLHQFTERNQVDAYQMALALQKENVGINDIQNWLERRYGEYSQMIDSVYGDLTACRQRVMDFLLYPKGMKPQGCRIEELEAEYLTLDRNPCYDLEELTQEVVTEMFDGNYGDLPEIAWTDKPYKSYFGMYRYPQEGTAQRPSILMNQLLNSKDVPRETVKYILYHELLHRDHRRHDAAFRAKERRFPDWTAQERFLDHTFHMFDLMHAM